MFCIYLEESTKTAASKAHADRDAASPDRSAANRQIVRKEIGAKWSKLSEQDLSALKDRDDLVSQVVARYGVDRSEAQRDVDFILKGRQI
jgi:hypothetical protein